MSRRRGALLLGTALLLPGAALLARAGYVRAKGAVGVILIDRALTATLADGVERRPWSWADMQPIARLRVPRLGVERAVLSNASGSAMAFGLGRIDGTSVIVGHRDSWAGFLEDVAVGDEVVLETHEGRTTYRVADLRVARFDDRSVPVDASPDRLVLVTCYPFRGWLHSPWRYVVRCERERA
ncbi:MAG TPA: class D sortase [Candidatus Polarisedimenticolaceae bacterium]|nr:class D sortase [Candidatus Polarisedimenticolaceae bacterium]